MQSKSTVSSLPRAGHKAAHVDPLQVSLLQQRQDSARCSDIELGSQARLSKPVVFPWVSGFLLRGSTGARDNVLVLPICMNKETIGQGSTNQGAIGPPSTSNEVMTV